MALALSALAVAVGPLCVARALATEPAPIAVVAPPNGQTFTPQGGIEFEVTGPPNLGNVYLEVAAGNSVGPEGRLLSTSRLEGISLESKPGSGTYSGKALFPPRNEGWSFTPGTYYWQVSGDYVEPSESLPFLHIREMLSPVYTIVIARIASSEVTGPSVPTPPESSATSPPPSTLTISAARRLVSVVIRRKTGRSPLHLTDDCVGRTQVEVVCETTWFSAWPATSHASRYKGKFTFTAQKDEVSTVFDGARGRWGCVRRVGSKRCTATVRWSIAIATSPRPST
jgi:hypothetical protein